MKTGWHQTKILLQNFEMLKHWKKSVVVLLFLRNGTQATQFHCHHPKHDCHHSQISTILNFNRRSQPHESEVFLCPHAALSGAVSASCSPSSQSGCSRLGSALYSISATLQPQLSMLQSCCSRYYQELAVRMIYRTLYFIASAIYFAMSAPVSSHAAADIAEWTQ